MSVRKELWIPVETSEGMFSTECAILLKLISGATVSFFADKNLIRDDAGKKLLKVFLVNDYPEQNKQLVLLPTETFETATRWAEVATA